MFEKLIKLFSFREYRNSGEHVPWGYGVAWYEFDLERWACYPLPFNFVATWIRYAWSFLMVLSNRNAKYPDMGAYARGWEAGFKMGKQVGYLESKSVSILESLDDLDELLIKDKNET